MMKNSDRNILLWGLTLCFAVLMSVPYIVPHTGFLALFGIVPLLMMERIASLSGTRRIWIFHYAGFLLWNAITTFWVCNATVGGGIFASVANAFQMSVIFGLFRFSKKYLSGALPYIFLAVTWIAWERAYFDAEISWPWLVLGNAFAGSIRTVQWYEFTGTLGGSLWIWAANLSLFGIMTALSDGRWNGWNIKAKCAAAGGYAILLLFPAVTSAVMFGKYEEKPDPLEFIALQPNIDPYNKFQALSQQQQNAILEEMAEKSLRDRKNDSTAAPLLLLAPETFTNDVIVNDITASRTYRRFASFLKNYPGVNMIFGASSYEYINSPEKPSHTARQVREGRWVESHNSALMTDGSGRHEIFHKNKLVVAVEKTPYPAVFCRVDDMLGGVMGRCIGQDSISVLHCVDPRNGESIPVGCAICYESVYGEYYTGYVRKGAKVMAIITNDAWWGNTPGYRQHLRYASLRAIETRRSIARCANTGISAMIDQKGVIHDPSKWWEKDVVKGTLNMNDELTFFVRFGDVTGRVCTFVFWLLAAALVVRLVVRKRQ